MAPVSARAADAGAPGGEVGSIERSAAALAAEVGGTAGDGLLVDWKRRLTEAATLLLLEQYDEAAYRYFVLAHDPVAAEAPERREAVFYLAESLWFSGRAVAARGYYEALAAAGVDAPYGRDSAVRLVEIASRLQDDAGIEAAFARFGEGFHTGEAVEPNVAYALAKSFFRRRQDAKADALFAQFDENGVRGRQALYFRGVIAVRRGDLDEAERFFDHLVRLPANNAEHAAVRDHARVSLARVRHERGAFAEAAELYAGLPDASPLRAEALHEKALSELRAGRARIAADDLDLFLIVFPEHALLPRVKLLRARALLAVERDLEAKEGYDAFAGEYAPASDAIADLLAGRPTPESFLARLGAADGRSGLDRVLPAPAAAAVWESRGMRRAAGLAADVRTEQRSLEDGRALASLLASGIARAEAAGLPEANERRRRAWSLELRAERARLAILQGAVARAGTPGVSLEGAETGVAAVLDARRAQAAAARDARGRIEALRARAEETRASIDGARARAVALAKYLRDSTEGALDAPGARKAASALREEIAGLDQRYAELGRFLGELDGREAATRAARLSEAEGAARTALTASLDAAAGALESILLDEDRDALRRLDASRATIAGTLDAIAASEKRRIAVAREAISTEAVALRAAGGDLRRVGPDANVEAAAQARRTLAQVRGTFEALLLRADLGALDVAWTRKDRESGRIRALGASREAALESMERRFAPLLAPDAAPLPPARLAPPSAAAPEDAP